MPRPDFPKTLAEFQGSCATEDACRRYLRGSRWPRGYRCPRCGQAEAYPGRAGPLARRLERGDNHAGVASLRRAITITGIGDHDPPD